MLLAGAPKDRDGGICESPLPYPKHACVVNWALTLPPGESLRRVDWAAAGLGQYRNPVSGAVANRHFDFLFGCFVFDPVSFAFQSVLFGLYRSFFIIGWKKDAVCIAFLLVF